MCWFNGCWLQEKVFDYPATVISAMLLHWPVLWASSEQIARHFQLAAGM
jgi:hypothetical protein